MLGRIGNVMELEQQWYRHQLHTRCASSQLPIVQWPQPKFCSVASLLRKAHLLNEKDIGFWIKRMGNCECYANDQLFPPSINEVAELRWWFVVNDVKSGYET